jgi:hypothetical protein
LLQKGETLTLYHKDVLAMGQSQFTFKLGPIGVEPEAELGST